MLSQILIQSNISLEAKYLYIYIYICHSNLGTLSRERIWKRSHQTLSLRYENCLPEENLQVNSLIINCIKMKKHYQLLIDLIDKLPSMELSFVWGSHVRLFLQMAWGMSIFLDWSLLHNKELIQISNKERIYSREANQFIEKKNKRKKEEESPMV